MCASKQKKVRQKMYASGQLDKNPEKTKAAVRKKKVRLTAAIVCIVLVIALAAGVVFGGALPEKYATALTVGSHKVSPATYQYFYQTVYNNIKSAYGDYFSYAVDPNKPLSQQTYDQKTGQSWADFLKEQTNTSISQAYAIYDDAMAGSYKLTSDEQSYLDSLSATLETYAKNNGSDSAEAYLVKTYGRGSTVASYKEYARITQIVSGYSRQHSDSLKYTDDEVESYYQQHKDTYDTVSYHSYLCTVQSGKADSSGKKKVDMTASEAMAKSIAEGGHQDESKFNELVYNNVQTDSKDYFKDGSATLTKDATQGNVPSELKSWLFDSSRKAGDTTYVESADTGYYVVYYVDNSSKNEVNMVNVRHILIEPEKKDDNASKTAAKEKAQSILDEFKAGAQTEDAFAALATKDSQDTGSASSGGLYKDVYPGQMETAFNDWCFDPSRKAGDTGIVETSYGYHVMYFSGFGENYRIYKVRNDMKTSATNDWAKALGEKISVKKSSFGMAFVHL